MSGFSVLTYDGETPELFGVSAERAFAYYNRLTRAGIAANVVTPSGRIAT